MDNESSVRDRLIRAGIVELEEHGIRDFSLRRVAQGAEVSCAAPYRHFKDKEELILAIVAYARESWELLAENITSLYSTDTEQCVIQLSLAALRFWLANGNLRSVLMSAEGEVHEAKKREINRFDAPLVASVRAHSALHGIRDAEELSCAILALLYGTVTLVSCGTLSATDGVAILTRHLVLLLG